MATARQTASGRDLLRMKPGPHPVVTCYLKIEPRDRTRQKYLTKVKNRVKALEASLASSHWTKAQQEMARLDLARILDFLGNEKNLPDSPGIALFASAGHKLFEVHELPKVHRSRLAIERSPLVRELAATEEEFGRLFTVTMDKTTALIWEVTAFAAKVVRKVKTEIARGSRFHAGPYAAHGEHTFHNRIANERKRHLETVARALFEEDRASPGHQIVLAGAGSDAQALEPFLHRYVADRLIGLARLAPKDATPSAVHQLTMDVREAHARASEGHHIEELAEGLGTGWAVNGVRDTLKALANGQVRLLLVRGDASLPGFRSLATGRMSPLARDLREDGEVVPTLDVLDDAIEEALRQRVALDVVYDPEASEAVDGLAGLLRFK